MQEKRRPVIGITGRRKSAAQIEGFPPSLAHLDADLYLTDYARSVLAAGGLPVFLPLEVDPADIAESLDGVLLTGGADVGPAVYGATRNPATTDEPIRDQHELGLLDAARDDDLPVLGICRGLQLINAGHGGTLHQDIPSHARYDLDPAALSHRVLLAEGSTLHEFYGSTHQVNSLHHQTVDRIGQDLQVTARADDGTVEGLESSDGRLLAVQWHPEMMHGRDADPVFVWLIDLARRHRDG